MAVTERGIGDNRPQPMTPEQVTEWLNDTCADLSKRQREILDGVARFHEKYETIPDDDVLGKASDFAGARGGAIAAFLKLAESRRVSEKQPFDQAATAVQGFFKRLTDDVTKARTTIVAKMNAYSEKVEAERRAKAEAEAKEAARLAKEAEAKALASMTTEELGRAAQAAEQAEQAQRTAQASAAERTRVTGQMGVTSSLRTLWKFEEAESDLLALVQAASAEAWAKEFVELSKRLPQEAARGLGEAIKHLQKCPPVPLHYLAFNTVRIGYAVRSEGVREIPGCVIKEVRSH